MSVPRAHFEQHPPAVWFEGNIDRATLRELFGALALNKCNIAVSRDEVMHLGDSVPLTDHEGFLLLPDTDATREYGSRMVEDFNETLEHYDAVDPGTVDRLLELARLRAERGY